MSNGGLKITPEQQAEEQSRPGRFPPLKGACMTGNGVRRTGGNTKNKLRPFLDGAFYVSRIPLEFCARARERQTSGLERGTPWLISLIYQEVYYV